MSALIRMALTPKEVEALMWATAHIGDRPDRETSDPTDPLFVLLAAGHSREAIMEATPTVEDFAHVGHIQGPLTPLQADILRVTVENSSWLVPYEQFGGGNKSENLATLRGFAKRLEAFGIEVNHIPSS